MSNPTITRETGIRVDVSQSRARQTQNSSVGFQLKSGLANVADGALGAAQVAAPFVPGGAVLSAAISGVGSVSSRIGSSSSGNTAAGGNSLGVSGSAGTPVSGGAGGSSSASLDKLANEGNSSAILMKEQNKMQEMNQSFNMQYLMLQQKMQDESRRFTLISNIMKTKHDTAKNSISNVR